MAHGIKELPVRAKPGVAVLEVMLAGKLTTEDYERFARRFEETAARNEKMRLFLTIDALEEWTAGAMWEDVKFDVKHFNDIERCAIVGDRKWEEVMTTLYKPFTRAEVRYFDTKDEMLAREWIRE